VVPPSSQHSLWCAAFCGVNQATVAHKYVLIIGHHSVSKPFDWEEVLPQHQLLLSDGAAAHWACLLAQGQNAKADSRCQTPFAFTEVWFIYVWVRFEGKGFLPTIYKCYGIPLLTCRTHIDAMRWLSRVSRHSISS
jgi:hypothetical protein